MRMNLQEMNDVLPNGLHDAAVEFFTHDLRENTVTFLLNLWVGSIDEPPETRERYRRGVLCFNDVVLFTKTESAYEDDRRMTLLTWALEEAQDEKAKLAKPVALFFAIAACYCEFRIACDGVWFEWTGAEEIICQ